MINLSQKLDRVVSPGKLNCPSGKLELKKADVKVLMQILSGKAEVKTAVDRKRAVNALVQVGDGRRESAEILEKILLDSGEEDATRISAAAGLGRYGDESSEQALIRAIDQTKGALQQEVLKSLGHIGGDKSYTALDSYSSKVEQGLRQTLSFSKILTGYRSKKVSIDPSQVRADLGVEWMKFDARKLPKKKLRESLKALRGCPFGLKLSEEIGYALPCWGVENTFLVNDSYRPGNMIKNLTSRSQVSGLVALQNPRELIGTVRYVVMTTLTESGIDIFVTRTSGEVVYAGEAAQDGKVWRFNVRDIGSTSAPTAISGVISDKEVKFEVRVIRKPRVKTGQRIN